MSQLIATTKKFHNFWQRKSATKCSKTAYPINKKFRTHAALLPPNWTTSLWQ